MKVTQLHDPSTLTDDQIQLAWEDAYTRFETPEEEVGKFIGRLNKLGQHTWPRDAQIVEIFCGKGSGIVALENLGFTNLEGVDLSPNLLAKYEGTAKLYEANCQSLPFEDGTRDIIIVQGGLHHLPRIPEDLERTLSEVKRVLRSDGKFVLVEPWLTPFLRMIHVLSDRYIIRLISSKFDAFAAMTHYEATTYFNWLRRSTEIASLLDRSFVREYSHIGLGKLMFVGVKKE
ncbi:MAG: methyltransferase domain-containing protein [Pyrinomonadaceae bacterium]